ncbi:MAG: DUF4013 domain-containing protein [Haloferacaceae archaeon]
MLADAITFPTTADDWVQTVVIGGVLSLLGVLILPTIVVQGYLVRAVRAGAAGEPAPSFTDWGDLLVDGLRLFVLVLGASLVVVVPLGVLAAIGMAGVGVTGSRAFAGVVGLAILLVVVAATIALGYLLPAAVANFAIEDSLAAALDLGAVLDGALTGEYATAWVLALLVGFVGATVGGPLTVVVVGAFLVFYTQVAVYYLFGRGFAAGLGRAPDTRPGPTPAGGASARAGDPAPTDEAPASPEFGPGARAGGTEGPDDADRGARDAPGSQADDGGDGDPDGTRDGVR